MKRRMRGISANLKRGASAALLSLAVASCAPTKPPSAVISAALVTLTENSRSICVDRETRGEPLAIFRNMASAPDPSRRLLAWYAPRPLSAYQDLRLQHIIGGEMRDQRVVLEQPGGKSPAPLPPAEQQRLNAAAMKLSLIESEGDAVVAPSLAAPRAHVRWWVFNRLQPNCGPIYTISRPVIVGDVAFVSAMAGHWATTYAIERKQGRWLTTAQWSSWLY